MAARTQTARPARRTRATDARPSRGTRKKPAPLPGEPIPWWDLATLSEALAARRVSPVEAVEAYLERIERLNRRYRAYISVYPEQALAEAKKAARDIRAGRHKGPLHGVPVAVKDIFQAEGMEMTCGSAIYRGQVAEADATAVARLKAAGAILLGKLNLHEFAFGPTGINAHYGSARNPWNPERFCGGSSSGSGCAAGAALAAGTLGTDTGGSIRIPAHSCGIVGLKPTFGLVSRDGIFPVCAQFDHGGPMTRTVRDAALMLSAIAGEDPADPSTIGAPSRDYSRGLPRRIKGLRIGVPQDYFFENLHPDVEAAVTEAIATLERLGARLQPVTLPDMQEAATAWNRIALASANAVHEAHLAEEREALGADVVARLLPGGKVTGPQYVKAEWVQGWVMEEMAEVHEEVDLIVAPTAPIPAGPIDGSPMTVGRRNVEPYKVMGKLTRLAPFTGQPAISVPCGFTRDGMPIGLQLIGRWLDDHTVLKAAHAYEQAAGWHKRRPPGLD